MLKTIGFSNRSVLWLVLAEAVLLVVLGGAIGLGIAAVLMPAISAASSGLVQLPHRADRHVAAGDRAHARDRSRASARCRRCARCASTSSTRWPDAEGRRMKRMQTLLGNMGILLALAAGLAAWVFMPWYGVLALAAALGLWLRADASAGASRSPRRSIGISSLPQRWARVGRDRRRHRRRGRRAGRDARDGRRLQGHAQSHRQRRQCNHPARWIAVRNQFRDHARPGAADHRAGRHRARQPMAVRSRRRSCRRSSTW